MNNKLNREAEMSDNIKNNKRVTVTHGELCLKPVSRIPKGARTSHTMYIASHSETGHNHVIEGRLDVVESEGRRYLLIKEVSKLFHQKTFDIHETRKLAPGYYEVTEKTEYNPFTKVIQRVFD